MIVSLELYLLGLIAILLFAVCFDFSCVFSVSTIPFDELIQRIQVQEQSSFFICKVVVNPSFCVT